MGIMTDIVEMFDALTLLHKVVVLTISSMIVACVALIYRVFKKHQTTTPSSPPEALKVPTDMKAKKGEVRKSRKSLRPWELGESERLMTYVTEDGVMRYSRHGPLWYERIRRIGRKLEREMSVKDAWEGLRDDFWETRMKALREVRPEIYEEIMYWEEHLDEYLFYMGFKLLFDIPYKEQDMWVRRNRSREGEK